MVMQIGPSAYKTHLHLSGSSFYAKFPQVQWIHIFHNLTIRNPFSGHEETMPTPEVLDLQLRAFWHVMLKM